MVLHGAEGVMEYFEDGDTIFREGDEGRHLYVIIRGAVQILKDGPDFISNIATLGEREILGEMSVIDSLPRSATAVAVGTTHLMAFDRESFRSAIQSHPDFGFEVIASLALKLRQTNEELQDVRAAYKRHQEEQGSA